MGGPIPAVFEDLTKAKPKEVTDVLRSLSELNRSKDFTALIETFKLEMRQNEAEVALMVILRKLIESAERLVAFGVDLETRVKEFHAQSKAYREYIENVFLPTIRGVHVKSQRFIDICRKMRGEWEELEEPQEGEEDVEIEDWKTWNTPAFFTCLYIFKKIHAHSNYLLNNF